MMRTSIIRRWFSQKNKVGMQNFFEINPIYPTSGEKDAVIFKERKPTIKPLEHSFHILRKRFKANDYIEARIEAAIKEPSRRDQDITKKIILEAETRLPLGMGFNWYIDKIKGRSSKNFSLRYVEIISDLIRKFQLRNEPQIVRFFRLAIADARSSDIIKQMKGSILQNVIKESVKRKGERQNKELAKNIEHHTQTIEVEGDKKQHLKESSEEMNIKLRKKMLEEERRKEFYAALKEIDANIAQSEINLKIHERHTLRHDLFDTNYDLPDELTQKQDLDADVANDNIRQLTTGFSRPFSGDESTQNYLIEQKIKKMYFLKKLQFIEGNEEKKGLVSPKEQATPYSINVGDHEYQIASLASKYNLLDIVPETEIDDIYNVIDLFLSQLNLNVKDNMTLKELKEEMGKQSIDPADYLWDSMRVDRIFQSTIHQNEDVEVKEEEKYNLDTEVQIEASVDPTPNYLVETTLNNTPFNVYQHTELGIFGQQTENRSFANLENIMANDEIDPSDTYRRFLFQIPKQKIPPAPRKWAPPTGDVYDYGKRKSGTALCRIRPGTGLVNINKNSIRHYFPQPYYRAQALKPALLTGICGKIDIDFYIQGSGIHSQAQACCNALSRALYKAYPRFKKLLRRAGLVTIDPRFKERKHSGHYKARKSYVYVRR